MPVTNYYSLDGEIIGEETGGIRIDYLTDALGSVTATLDQTATVVNTYTYKPCGAQLAKTGVGGDPAYQWVGSLGYRRTGNSYSDVYVVARHYDDSAGRWTSSDSDGRDEESDDYGYCGSSPTTYTDPLGMQRKVSQGKRRRHTGTCTIPVQIIDTGPDYNLEPPRMMDLHPYAAKQCYAQIGRKWYSTNDSAVRASQKGDKGKRKRKKSRNSCDEFGGDGSVELGGGTEHGRVTCDKYVLQPKFKPWCNGCRKKSWAIGNTGSWKHVHCSPHNGLPGRCWPQPDDTGFPDNPNTPIPPPVECGATIVVTIKMSWIE